MTPLRCKISFVLASIVVLATQAVVAQDQQLRFRVAIPDPHLGRADVEVLIPDAPAGDTRLAFAERLEGRLVRDNPAAFVTDLQADDGTNPLVITRRALREVVVNRPTAGEIRVRYRRTFNIGSESIFEVRNDGATWVGAGLFPTLPQRSKSVAVEISAPHGWSGTSSLPAEGTFRWTAQNSAVLETSRFHVGKFEEWRGEDRKWPLIVVADRPLGSAGAPTLKLVTNLVDQAQRAVTDVPLTFISLHVTPEGPERPAVLVSGSTIDVRVRGRIDEPTARTQTLSALARALVRLRIPGKSSPVGWRVTETPGDPSSPLGWFSEGAADWLGTLLAVRADILPESAISDFLTARLEADARNRSTFSAADQSVLMFDRTRRGAPVLAPDPAIRGSLIAASLDLAIRKATRGARGLEDVVRVLLNSPDHATFDEQKLQRSVDSVEARAIPSTWWTKFVHETAPIDLTPALATVGFDLATHGADGHATLGVTVAGATVKSLTADSPLRLAGAREGDVLVGIGTALVGDAPSETVEQILSRRSPGDLLTVTWRRSDGTIAQKLVRTEAPVLRYRMTDTVEPSEEVRLERRKFIYGSETR